MHHLATPTLKHEVDYEEWYHKARHNNHFNEPYYNARARVALDKFFAGIDRSDRILDFGCGLGQNILFMPNAIGYDISHFGIEFCRRKGIKATSRLEDLANESFDVVFSSHVLEHHPHPKTMIEDMRSKLKRGKKLILVIPFERHKKASFQLDLNQHLYAWNFQAINNLLITCGFEILKNRYVHGAGYNRLLFLSKINFRIYQTATILLSKLAGIREMMIVARKI